MRTILCVLLIFGTSGLLNAQNPKRTLKAHTCYVNGVAFSPDGKRIVSGGLFNRCAVKVWDARTGEEILTLGDPSSVYSLAFSPDGKHIVSGGGVYVTVWDSSSPK